MSYLVYVDDNADMRCMVRDLLEPRGHEVALAVDGHEALAIIRERAPDLLILDLAMPGISGYEVCRAVKDDPVTSYIPVLMLTGLSRIDEKVAGFEAGADDYLAKPFDTRELEARVGALLRLVRREADRNPTSGLPGGEAIERELARHVGTGDPFAVCYIDLDHFKPFCDTLGFGTADRVIQDTGRALLAAAVERGDTGDFVGHIGGDDFIIVTVEERAESIARDAARRFREVVGQVVGDEVVMRGTFAGVDREGMTKLFPIAQLTAVVLLVDPTHWVSTSHLGALAARAKRRARLEGRGTIRIERV
jgi:PleD family two-component response regulator